MINPYAAPTESGLTCNTERVEGVFRAPIIGVVEAPAGFTGPGALYFEEQELVIDAPRVSHQMAFGVAGLVVGAAVGIIASSQSPPGRNATRALVALFALAGSVAGLWLGRVLRSRKARRTVVPYTAVSNLALDGSTLRFKLVGPVQGTVTFVAQPGSLALLQEGMARMLSPAQKQMMQNIFDLLQKDKQ